MRQTRVCVFILEGVYPNRSIRCAIGDGGIREGNPSARAFFQDRSGSFFVTPNGTATKTTALGIEKIGVDKTGPGAE
jgi:hypothetical protein